CVRGVTGIDRAYDAPIPAIAAGAPNAGLRPVHFSADCCSRLSLEHVAGGSTWLHAFFGAGVGSLLFGMAALATRGLALPIGLHAAWNFGDWVHGGKDSIGLWHPIVADGFRHRADSAAMVCY